MPPPRTRSNSPMPVSTRVMSSKAMSDKDVACDAGPLRAMLWAAFGASGTTFSSSIVFHSPHWGQRPSQRLETLPQLVQT